MASLYFSPTGPFSLDSDAGFPQLMEVRRGFYFILRFILVPAREMGGSLCSPDSPHLALISTLVALTKHGRRWLPMCCTPFLFGLSSPAIVSRERVAKSPVQNGRLNFPIPYASSDFYVFPHVSPTKRAADAQRCTERERERESALANVG